ncbi:MAG: di-trans,poly-cis-decaprenylcistransferase [Actinobacteria bacterium RBG_16_68_21]|nr:MAG: di-trans,poly-cis-decaprenylcistransferase [Actinobacteria bacterium RBG_16_68_21]
MGFKENLLVRRRDELNELGVRVRFLGDRDDPRVSDRLRLRIREAEELTAGNTRMTMVFAFNYGSRAEIAAAAVRVARAAVAGDLEPDAVTPEVLAAHFEMPEMPDPDLVIRTSGEFRLSNFLLWQSAYSEFAFPDTLWPDFTPADLEACVTEYRRRQRRFGGVGE